MKRLGYVYLLTLLWLTQSNVYAIRNCVWIGNTSTLWSEPLNWDSNPAIPGETDSARVFFYTPTSSLYMPVVDVAQPSGTNRIQQLTFTNANWTIGGTAILTLDVGSANSLGYDTTTPYIKSSGIGTNVISGPVVLGSGSQGNAVISSYTNSVLRLGSDISYTGVARNVMLSGGGTIILNGAFRGADLILLGNTSLALANPLGEAYIPASGLKLRLNGSTATWYNNNQINATNKAILVRMDGNAIANVNGMTDTVNQLTFAVDTSDCGTFDTGTSGLVYLRATAPMIAVGTTNRITTSTATIRGRIAMTGTATDTYAITTRRGTPAIDLLMNASIAGLSSLSLETINASVSAGVVVFTGTNTYNGSTKIKSGTLRVNTVGASGVGAGKVEVFAGSRLEGTGVIDQTNAASTVAVSGTLAPGDPTGTMRIGSSGSENNLTLSTGSALEIRINETGCAAVSVFGSVTLTGTTTLNLVESGLPEAGTYPIISASNGIMGDFAQINGLSERTSVYKSADNKQLWLRIADLATLVIIK